jgi:hypothetical protein
VNVRRMVRALAAAYFSVRFTTVTASRAQQICATSIMVFSFLRVGCRTIVWMMGSACRRKARP